MTQQLGALTVLVEDSDSSTLCSQPFLTPNCGIECLLLPPKASVHTYIHVCTHTYKLFKHTHAYIFPKKNIKGCLLSVVFFSVI